MCISIADHLMGHRENEKSTIRCTILMNDKDTIQQLKVVLEIDKYYSVPVAATNDARAAALGEMRGINLADAAGHFSPEAIILVGGLAVAGDLIFKPTKRLLKENLFGIFKDKVKLVPSDLTDGNTALLGTSARIWKNLEKSSLRQAVFTMKN